MKMARPGPSLDATPSESKRAKRVPRGTLRRCDIGDETCFNDDGVDDEDMLMLSQMYDPPQPGNEQPVEQVTSEATTTTSIQHSCRCDHLKSELDQYKSRISYLENTIAKLRQPRAPNNNNNNNKSNKSNKADLDSKSSLIRSNRSVLSVLKDISVGRFRRLSDASLTDICSVDMEARKEKDEDEEDEKKMKGPNPCLIVVATGLRDLCVICTRVDDSKPTVLDQYRRHMLFKAETLAKDIERDVLTCLATKNEVDLEVLVDIWHTLMPTLFAHHLGSYHLQQRLQAMHFQLINALSKSSLASSSNPHFDRAMNLFSMLGSCVAHPKDPVCQNHCDLAEILFQIFVEEHQMSLSQCIKATKIVVDLQETTNSPVMLTCGRWNNVECFSEFMCGYEEVESYEQASEMVNHLCRLVAMLRHQSWKECDCSAIIISHAFDWVYANMLHVPEKKHLGEKVEPWRVGVQLLNNLRRVAEGSIAISATYAPFVRLQQIAFFIQRHFRKDTYHFNFQLAQGFIKAAMMQEDKVSEQFK